MKTPTPQLQWGRGLKTPEMRRGKAWIEDSTPLQWGRGLKTPEIAHSFPT